MEQDLPRKWGTSVCSNSSVNQCALFNAKRGLVHTEAYGGMPMGELIGYARTSTKDQRLDLQRDALRAAGVQDRHLYSDQASGARKDRPGFLQCWAYLHRGDTLVVWRLDRLARSLRHLIELGEELVEREIQLK